jgi:hypothetical protein
MSHSHERDPSHRDEFRQLRPRDDHAPDAQPVGIEEQSRQTTDRAHAAVQRQLAKHECRP